MAPSIREHLDSPKVTYSIQNPAIERLLMVFDTESDAIMNELVLNFITPYYGGLVFQEYIPEYKGGGYWDVSVKYGTLEARGAGSFSPSFPSGKDPTSQQPDGLPSSSPGSDSQTLWKFSFDTTGGTAHRMYSLETVGVSPSLGSNLNFYQTAIGVSDKKDGFDIKGVDVTVPTFKYTELHYIPLILLTNKYLATLLLMTGRVNKKKWRFFNEGECLFLGASGSRYNQTTAEITYNFAGSPNEESLTVAGIPLDKPAPTASNPNPKWVKKGWEYAWVKFKKTPDDATKQIIPTPDKVYVERVYEEADFGLLGLGS